MILLPARCMLTLQHYAGPSAKHSLRRFSRHNHSGFPIVIRSTVHYRNVNRTLFVIGNQPGDHGANESWPVKVPGLLSVSNV
jgi:hypothetical protein